MSVAGLNAKLLLIQKAIFCEEMLALQDKVIRRGYRVLAKKCKECLAIQDFELARQIIDVDKFLDFITGGSAE